MPVPETFGTSNSQSKTSPTKTQLSPRVLVLVRVAWWLAFVTSLAVLILSLPSYYDYLLSPLDTPSTIPGSFSLTQENAELLEGIGLSLESYAVFTVGLLLFRAAMGSALGLVLFLKRPDDWVAMLVSFSIMMSSIIGPMPTLGELTLVETAFYLPLWIQFNVMVLSVIAVFTLFPTGQFYPRWLLWVFLLQIGIYTFNLFPSTNWVREPLPSALVSLQLLPIMVGGVIGQYRNIGNKEDKQQIKIAVYTMVIAITIVLVPTILRVLPIFEGSGGLQVTFLLASNLLYTFAAVIYGIGFFVATARYRLWDIDFVINRSLVYGAVTLVVVAMFLTALIVLQIAFGGQQAIVALGISLVVMLMVFNPLRSWVARQVDLRLYGLRYDIDEMRRAEKKPVIANPGLYTGRQIGAYTTLGVLGKGGMGEVYRAEGDGQTVALKILPLNMAEKKEFRQRFTREAKTLKSLKHPNIVQMVDSGVTDDLYYIAMEYISGPALSEKIKQEENLSLEEALSITQALASALDYAHQQGLVHRDIKASNVMLRPHDEGFEAVLMDFGIAKLSEDYTRYTASDGAIGTIDYMAPEQIATAKTVDHRADLYAFGVLLYEMLSGTRPFKGSPGQIVFAHIQQPPPNICDVRPDIPPHVGEAIMQVMSKDPDDRFSSGQAFVEALQHTYA